MVFLLKMHFTSMSILSKAILRNFLINSQHTPNIRGGCGGLIDMGESVLKTTLMILLIFTAIDYMVHSSNPAYTVPETYFINKLIYGFVLIYLAIHYTPTNYSILKRSIVVALAGSLLMFNYINLGYPQSFIQTFLIVHASILLTVSYIIFKRQQH